MLALGTKIKELRTAKKLTQKELAEKLTVTPQAVSKWERNESNPDLDMLLELSRYFNVTVDELLGNKPTSFFEALLSRKGRPSMNQTMTQPEGLDPKEQRTVMIFEIVFSLVAPSGLMHTQVLATKMSNSLKQQHSPLTVKSYSSSLLDEVAGQAAAILLTPTFAYAKKEIEKKFPNIPVIAITKRDFGILNAEKLVAEVLAAIG